jgi:hypothetical protein
MRSSLLCLALAALAVGSTACGGDVTYGYFHVDVKIDKGISMDCLNRVYACAAKVSGASDDEGDLSCIKGAVNYDFGAFEYSTRAKGTVKFTVVLMDVNRKEILTGDSPEVGIMPNASVNTTVTVKEVDCKDPNLQPK